MTDKNDAIALKGMEGMISTQRPEGVDTGDLGYEHIGKEDILIPRLALAQKTSPEIDPTSPRFIEGLQFTDLFNSVGRSKYGKGPLHFVILRADRPRFVEFIPLAEGGGVRDPNVPADDPRTKFGAIDPATNKSAKPIATKFYDFIVLLLNDLDFNDPMKNVMGLSMKSTAIKVAKQLNLLITQRGKKALYKGVYELSTDSDKNALGAFAIYKVKNAGWLTAGSAAENMASEMWNGWKDRQVKIDLETEHPEGDTSFDPVELEKQPPTQTDM